MSENMCVINAQSGIGTASPQVSQFTHNCDCIKFIINKDFTSYALVVITSIGNTVSVVSEGDALVKAYDSETKETTALWYPSGEITAESGCVIYQLAAYDAENQNTIWYSKEGRLIVTDSIDTTDYSAAAVGSSPNLVTQLLTLVKSLELDVTNLSDTKVDKEEGKTLTSNDFTNEQKAALEKAIEDIANSSELINKNSEELDGHTERIISAEDSISYLQSLADENKGELTYDASSEKAQSGKAVAQAIAAIVNSAPDTLNTLEELAAALGDDPNFATTIMTLLGGKVDKEDGKMLSENDYTDEDKEILQYLNEQHETFLGELGTVIYPAIDGKVDKVEGKMLSENDYSNEEKQKLSDVISFSGRLNDEKAEKEDLNNHIADTSNPHSVTKEQIGLENVDNTRDSDKPISKATSAALGEKLDIVSYDSDMQQIQNSIETKVDKVEGKGLSTNDYTDKERTQLETNTINIANLQAEITSFEENMVQTITGSQEDVKYPSAAAVYNFVNSAIGEALEVDY